MDRRNWENILCNQMAKEDGRLVVFLVMILPVFFVVMLLMTLVLLVPVNLELNICVS